MIIGLTGTVGSGKSILAGFLREKGFVYLSLSDELRQIAHEMKVEPSRKSLQDLGNSLRKKRGNGFLAEMVLQKIVGQDLKKAVVDGIRNPAEIDILKGNKGFVLVGIDASQKIRFERVRKRKRQSDPSSWKDFLAMDARDKGKGEGRSGQQVLACIRRADCTIFNEGSITQLQSRIEKLYDDIDRKMPRPSWDEYFIEISNAVSRRATCNRGRSGCVVVKNKHILVTGYVGSPLGLPHCDEVGHQMKTVVHEDGTKTQHCLRTTHAEQNAICQAAKLGVSLDGATLYCKMTPCATCAKLIINAGIKRVVAQHRYHAGSETEKMFKQAGIKLDMLNNEVLEYGQQ